MGRVNRLMERRALRRAADQALLTSLGVASPGRPGGPADRNFHYARASRIDVAPPSDHEPVTEPIAIADTAEPRSRRPDETPGNGQPPTPVEPPRARSVAEAAYLPTALDFAAARYRGRPWYRTKPAAAAVVAAVIVAVLCTGWVVLHAPSTTAEQSTSETTSAKPAPTMTPPASAGPVKSPPAPAPPPPPPTPPPPPPPPPPPVERTYSPSQGQYQPRYSAPTLTQGPRIDVTRAPMSVAPTPKPVQSNDSSAPGDAPDRGSGRRRGCFGFC